MDPTTGLHIHTHHQGDYTVMAIGGEVDVANAYLLRERLLEVLRSNAPLLVVDLSGISFCDASGLAALVAARRRTHLLGGGLRLAGPRPQLLKVLRITGLYRHFATYPTVPAACLRPVGGGRPERPRPFRDRDSVSAGDRAGGSGEALRPLELDRRGWPEPLVPAARHRR